MKQLISQLPTRMDTAVKYGAQYECYNKTYKNHTEKLMRSTKGQIVRANRQEIVVELVMGTEYASHVVRLGYSAIREAARRVKTEIQHVIEQLAR